MESSDVRVYEHIGYLNNWPLKGHLLRIETHNGELKYHSLWGIKKICLAKEVKSWLSASLKQSVQTRTATKNVTV